jgi:hypothetical protein
MIEITNTVDVSPTVEAILFVKVKPYVDLIARLRSEGRITDEEIASLVAECSERQSRLADLVQERMSLQADEPKPNDADAVPADPDVQST